MGNDSTEFAFLPALSYNSDLGLIGGGITSWYNYKDNIYPFYSYTTINGVLSTKGLASFSFFYDKPFAFGKDIRITTYLYGARFFEDAFFGIGNYSKITDTPKDSPRFYEFQSFNLGFTTEVRFPLKKFSSHKQLDLNIVADFNYETPWDNDSDRLISIDEPVGVNGGRTSLLGLGLIWESRNSEFQPKKGNYAKSSIEIGEQLWGSSYDIFVVENEIRQYLTFHLIKEITFASRLYSRFTSGNVPYWELSYAGDDETLRGYENKRFIDDNVLFLNSELRTWLFNFPEFATRIGGTLFIDTGRTFANGEHLNVISNDLKTTIGFGGLASFFTDDFIIRGDFGFSEEGLRIYFSTGFMF